MAKSTRLALITGGTSGLGLAIAQKLAPSCELALTYKSQAHRASQACENLSLITANRVGTFAGPLESDGDARRLYDQVLAHFGRAPDVVIGCAGQYLAELFLSADFSAHEQMIHQHLIAHMALAKYALEAMYRSGFGRIIHISSVAAHRSFVGTAGYAAAKAGMEAFTRVLALEVAHRGVTVNAIAPGLMKTPMTESIRKTQNPRLIPAGYFGDPEEVGSLAAFLCSDAARYITGAVIAVDGGLSLGTTER